MEYGDGARTGHRPIVKRPCDKDPWKVEPEVPSTRWRSPVPLPAPHRHEAAAARGRLVPGRRLRCPSVRAVKSTTVQIFVTCLVDSLFPEVGESVVSILEAQGLTVEFPFDQTCCGQPAYNAGYPDEARAMAEHTLDVLDDTDGPIVVPSGSCAQMIVDHIGPLVSGRHEYRREGQARRRPHSRAHHLSRG